jgi:hypothetical protein
LQEILSARFDWDIISEPALDPRLPACIELSQIYQMTQTALKHQTAIGTAKADTLVKNVIHIRQAQTSTCLAKAVQNDLFGI